MFGGSRPLPKILMKILFVCHNTEFVRLFKPLWREIVKQGNQLTVLFEENNDLWKVRETENPLTIMNRELPQVKLGMTVLLEKSFKFSVLLFMRHIDQYRFYLNMPQSKYYKTRAISKYPLILKIMIKLGLLKWNGWDKWIEKTEKWVEPQQSIRKHIAIISPDVVMASPLVVRFIHLDNEYAKAAMLMGIKTYGLAATWDCLTSKGRMIPVPDKVFCWNKHHKEELIKYHRVPEDRIIMTGSVQFEDWLSPRTPSTRKNFCEKWGLDPNKTIILYLGSSKTIVEDERWVIEKKRNELSSKFQLIVRPHPVNFQWFENSNFKMDGVWIIPSKGDLPKDDKSMQLMYDMVYHSDFVTGINTSAMIESLLLGKTTFVCYVKEYIQTQQECYHFKQIEKYFSFKHKEIKTEFLNLAERPSKKIVSHLMQDVV